MSSTYKISDYITPKLIRVTQSDISDSTEGPFSVVDVRFGLELALKDPISEIYLPVLQTITDEFKG